MVSYLALVLAMIRLDVMPKAKAKTKWDPTTLKNFCTAKETTNKMKKQPTE